VLACKSIGPDCVLGPLTRPARHSVNHSLIPSPRRSCRVWSLLTAPYLALIGHFAGGQGRMPALACKSIGPDCVLGPLTRPARHSVNHSLIPSLRRSCRVWSPLTAPSLALIGHFAGGQGRIPALARKYRARLRSRTPHPASPAQRKPWTDSFASAALFAAGEKVRMRGSAGAGRLIRLRAGLDACFTCKNYGSFVLARPLTPRKSWTG